MLIQEKTTAFKDIETPDESKLHLVGWCWIATHTGLSCLPRFNKNVTFTHLHFFFL